ncbi:MAG: GrpB family protein [Candidatus Bathyarchaeota archaeon]|nr:GrpB family protein [Candidatus Bathyarchaeota archaeon]
MNRSVRIVDYDPQWPIIYEEEKRRILEVVGDIIARIEHVGSTAVPNLGAKPIIDIMVAVDKLEDAEKCIEPLQRIRHEYQPEQEAETPERRFFRKGNPPKEQHYHLHMVNLTSDFWKRHLLFRDCLRTHPKTAQEYYKLKKRLAGKYGLDREGYTKAKTSFIEAVLAEAKAERLVQSGAC